MIIYCLKWLLYKIIYLLGYIHFPKKNKKITVFLRLDAIGDFVLWLPAFNEYIARHPDEYIVLICSEQDAYMAKKYARVDRIILCNKKEIFSISDSLWNFLKKNLQLSRVHCNKLIIPIYSRTVELSIAAYLIKADKKIAIDGDATGMPEDINSKHNKIYSDFIKTTPYTISEIKRNAEFMSKICSGKIVPHLADLKSKKKYFHDALPYFVIIPGGSIEWKCWDVNRYVAVAVKLQQQYNLKCVICGNEKEKRLGIPFEKQKQLEVINLIGKTSIEELIEIIEHAEFLVGNDSAGIHIAAATSTLAFCIFHGAYYGRFLPYNLEDERIEPVIINQKRACYGCALGKSGMDAYSEECKRNIECNNRYLCLDEVTIEKVVEVIETVLENKRNED